MIYGYCILFLLKWAGLHRLCNEYELWLWRDGLEKWVSCSAEVLITVEAKSFRVVEVCVMRLVAQGAFTEILWQ